MIIFPFNGFEHNSDREQHFWQIIDCCKLVDPKPIIIINRDTERRNETEAFKKKNKKDETIPISIWSVDTCQMWLHGWGYIIDNFKGKGVERIVQLPGDIDDISDKEFFFNELKRFVNTTNWEIAIGDFYSKSNEKRFTSKELIDIYGTFALLANWFPKIHEKIIQLPLNKPRSEFINIKIDTLDTLLYYRKFAYEQTINILIRYLHSNEDDWKKNITTPRLGSLQDDNKLRGYSGCLNQIERTERLLKMLWRELQEPLWRKKFEYTDPDWYHKFLDKYNILNNHSSSICESARITIRSLLWEKNPE
jgi:hypothetical protein